MSLLSFAADAVIPPWVKPVLIGLVVAIALGGAAAGGAAVNGWRLDAAHQKEMTAEKDRYDELSDKVREQNRAVEAMGFAKKAADERRDQAERFAAFAMQHINNRDLAVANSKATNCDGVLKEAWGNWR